MDSASVLGVVFVGIGSGLAAVGVFLKWWIPEEKVGWYFLLPGILLVATGVALLRWSRGPDESSKK